MSTSTATTCRRSATGGGRPDAMRILALNGGSSSFKCELYEASNEPLPAQPPKPEWHAQLEGKTAVAMGPLIEAALKTVPGPIDVVGHRIVQGGPKYRASTFVDPAVRAAIALEAEVAPAHNRFELAAMDAVDRVFGAATRQVAVFDASFHSTLEPAAYVYPGPYEWLADGIRRYGFHGISHQYASRPAAEILGRESLRLIVCPLGNGASLA